MAALGRKLTSDDKEVRAAALQLLAQMPECVVLALEPVLGTLRDDLERQAAEHLLTEVKRRQEAIRRLPPLFNDDKSGQE